jgi:integrase
VSRRKLDGEGSVYQRASDGLWVAAVTLPSGRRKVAYGATEREAQRQRRALLAQVEAGRPAPAGRTPTLGRDLVHWLTTQLPAEVAAGHIEPETADHYRTMIETHVLPTDLAGVRRDRVSVEDVRAWQRAKLAEVNPRTGRVNSARLVGAAHAVLRRALADRVRDEVLARNVAALVRLPAGQRRAAEAPTEEELAAVFAEMVTDRRRALWVSMLALGIRKGEALAMRWSRVDLDAGAVQIHAQVVRRRGDPDPATGRRRGELVEKTLKTTASRATLSMPRLLVATLREHRREQARARLAARVWVDPDLVHASEVGTFLDPRNVNRWWSGVCQRAGVRALHVHDLRHGAASLAFASGASIREIQEMLRHTRQGTTADVYTHLFESVRAGTAEKLDGALRALGEAGSR